MPFGLDNPTVLQANSFLQSFDLEMQAQMDLCMNPLQLFNRNEGTYILETELTVNGKKHKHFAVYCSTFCWNLQTAKTRRTQYSKEGTGLLVDNGDGGHDQIGIEAGDRVDQKAAVAALKGKWPGIGSALLINAYKLARI